MLALGAVLAAGAVAAGEKGAKETGLIVICTELGYPPYSLCDEKGQPAGFNADLTRAIAKTMGLAVEVRIGPWAEIRKALESGQIDAICGMYYSVERDKSVDFSPPYTIVHHAIFAREDEPPVRVVDDLRGKEIIVMQGDIMHDYVLEKGISQSPVLASTQADALRLLASGKHDYALVAKLPGLYLVKELDLSNVIAVGPPICPEKYCYAVTEGNAELLAKFTEGLAIVKKTGQYQEIYDRWLGVLEPKGVPVRKILKYAAMVVIPLLALLVASALWSGSLKRQVSRRTVELKREIAERQRAQEALAAESERLDVTLRSIGDAVIATDTEGQVVLINEVAENLTGWAQEEAVGQPAAEVFHIVNERTRQRCEDPVAKVLHSGAVVGLANDTVLIARDGTERVIADSGAPIHDPQGQVIGVVMVFRDITERRRTERVVAEAREYAESIIATVREPLVVLDAELKVVSANRSFYQTFGVTQEETDGQLLYDLGNRQWRIPRLRELLEEILPENTSFDDFEVEHDFATIGPRVMLLSGRRIYREGNETQMILLAIEDMTERRRVQDQLLRQSAVLDAINGVFQEALTCETEEQLGKSCLAIAERLTGSKFGFLGELNSAGLLDDIAISNPGWDACEMAVEDARKAIKDMPIRGFDRCTIREGKSRIVNRDEMATHPDRVGTPEGHPEITAFLGVPLRHEGKVIGMIGLGNKEPGYETADQEAVESLAVVIVEALRHKRAAEELRESRERLEERVVERTKALERSNKELESFAYAASHDLQEPLRMVTSFAELLAKHYRSQLDEKAHEFIDYIVGGTTRMQRLISDLLTLSRVGRAEEPPEPIDCSEALDEALANLQAAIEESGVVVGRGDLPEIPANYSQLVQLFQNLVSNAIKYRGDEPLRVDVTAERQPGEWRFAVRDNGIGIDPEHLDRIFVIFQRLHPPDEYSGTGIGLAICKKIVELRGGRIWAESEPGEGSTFRFTIPTSDT